MTNRSAETKRRCVGCGAPLTGRRDQKYCNDECGRRTRRWAARGVKPGPRRCVGCAAVFDGRYGQKYCTDRCQNRTGARRRRSRATEPDKASRCTAGISTVVRGTNGVLIAEAARLGYLGDEASTVLDTTYGRGLFWTRYRPPGLIVSADDFRNLSRPDRSIDVVVFDPPYISTGNRDTSSVPDLYDRFGLGELTGWHAIRRLIDDGLAECARVVARRGFVLVKCMDYVESGRKVWNTFHVHAEAERLGLRMVDRFHHLTGGGPQPTTNLDGTPRRQRTAREVSSMLMIFTTGSAAP